MIKTIPISNFDRSRVAALIPNRKTTLNSAWSKDPSICAHIVSIFFIDLSRTASQLLNGPVALLLDFCTLRHNKLGDVDQHPMHTDAAFFPPNGNGLTFWCPLDSVGDTAPGVTIQTESGEYTPRIGPGLALVIPPDVEHRTQNIDGERVSIEYRCSPVNSLPSNIARSPIATYRKRRNQVGALIEADGQPITFIVFNTTS